MKRIITISFVVDSDASLEEDREAAADITNVGQVVDLLDVTMTDLKVEVANTPRETWRDWQAQRQAPTLPACKGCGGDAFSPQSNYCGPCGRNRAAASRRQYPEEMGR